MMFYEIASTICGDYTYELRLLAFETLEVQPTVSLLASQPCLAGTKPWLPGAWLLSILGAAGVMGAAPSCVMMMVYVFVLTRLSAVKSLLWY